MVTRSQKAAKAATELQAGSISASNNEDQAVEDLQVQLQSVSINFTSVPSKEGQQEDDDSSVLDAVAFKELVVDLVNRVYEALGDAQLEKTYQRALQIELNKLQPRGVRVLEELSIPIRYDGVHIGTRRADLVLVFHDGSRCILELKAVKTGLSSSHLRQLKYYMAAFGVPNGLLINFPRMQDFPDLDDDVQAGFDVETLQGGVLSDRNLRKRVASSPEIFSVNNDLLLAKSD